MNLTLTTVEWILLVWGTLTAAATPFLVIYARRAAKKTAEFVNYPVTDQQLDELERFVPMVVAYIDEWVRKFARGMVQEAPPKTAEDKQALAVRLLRERAPSGLDKLGDPTLKMAVDAAVHDRRVSIPPITTLAFPPAPSSYPPPPSLPIIPPPKVTP